MLEAISINEPVFEGLDITPTCHWPNPTTSKESVPLPLYTRGKMANFGDTVVGVIDNCDKEFIPTPGLNDQQVRGASKVVITFAFAMSHWLIP